MVVCAGGNDLAGDECEEEVAERVERLVDELLKASSPTSRPPRVGVLALFRRRDTKNYKSANKVS